jgi:hypothetical protein
VPGDIHENLRLAAFHVHAEVIDLGPTDGQEDRIERETLDIGQFESLIIRCHLLFIRIGYFLSVNSARNAVFVEGNLSNEL